MNKPESEKAHERYIDDINKGGFVTGAKCPRCLGSGIVGESTEEEKRFPEKRYFYGGIDLVPTVEALIEYVTDSDLGGNLLGDLRRLRERILNEKGVTRG